MTTTTPTLCAICRRRANDVSFRLAGREIMWLCGDPQCTAAAHKIAMVDLDALELRAMEAAGAQAGAFLDSIGTTDLAQLSQEQWGSFLSLVVCGFSDELRKLVLSGEAPF